MIKIKKGVTLAVVSTLGFCSVLHAQNARKEAIKAFFQKETTKASGARQLGTLKDKHITESSGLAVSHTTPGVLWTHNDSGDGPNLFAINLKGETLVRYTVSGANNVDWEAVSVGPGRSGKPAIYIGDIGDNNFNRDDTAIYRIPEPKVNTAKTKDELDTILAEKFGYRYPDGAHNGAVRRPARRISRTFCHARPEAT